MKANTPPVSDPNYSDGHQIFINQNVPDTYGGQQVNFLEYFNDQGGLTIWGAPISNPAPDPTNNNFIYQRFQRGIMHYIQGTGTESILVADYLKALILNRTSRWTCWRRRRHRTARIWTRTVRARHSGCASRTRCPARTIRSRSSQADAPVRAMGRGGGDRLVWRDRADPGSNCRPPRRAALWP